MPLPAAADVARELRDAYRADRSCRRCCQRANSAFDLTTAYAVEAELVRLRRADGRTPSAAKSATPTRRSGARSSSRRSSGRTCTTTPCSYADSQRSVPRHRADDRAEDRAGDCLQDPPAARGYERCRSRARRRRVDSAGIRDHRLPLSPTGSFSRRISWQRSVFTRRSSSASRRPIDEAAIPTLVDQLARSRSSCRETVRSWKKEPEETHCAVPRSVLANWRRRLSDGCPTNRSLPANWSAPER